MILLSSRAWPRVSGPGFMSRGEGGVHVSAWYGVQVVLVCGRMKDERGGLCGLRAHVPPGGNTKGAR